MEASVVLSGMHMYCNSDAVMRFNIFICSFGKDVAKIGIFHRCPGLPAETSTGFCEAD